MLKIYNELVSRFNILAENHTPISNIANDYGFKPVENRGETEFYRAELSDGDEMIIIRIWGSDHSGELQYRKDTYHNEVCWKHKDGSFESSEYMYLDDYS